MTEVETLRLPPGDDVPNSALPVLLYRAAFVDAGDRAGRMEVAFREHGWRGLWRNGIFAYHHFHDNAHEVLGIAEGEVSVQLGGAAGPEVRLSAGDVVVLPAGTGHKRLSASPDLLVIGGYPPGQERPTLLEGGKATPEIAARCAAVPVTASDPVDGTEGALTRHWQAAIE
jgi:uncharacterized protein YjlB